MPAHNKICFSRLAYASPVALTKMVLYCLFQEMATMTLFQNKGYYNHLAMTSCYDHLLLWPPCYYLTCLSCYDNLVTYYLVPCYDHHCYYLCYEYFVTMSLFQKVVKPTWLVILMLCSCKSESQYIIIKVGTWQHPGRNSSGGAESSISEGC